MDTLFYANIAQQWFSKCLYLRFSLRLHCLCVYEGVMCLMEKQHLDIVFLHKSMFISIYTYTCESVSSKMCIYVTHTFYIIPKYISVYIAIQIIRIIILICKTVMQLWQRCQ